jgi:hypothetical protein
VSITEKTRAGCDGTRFQHTTENIARGQRNHWLTRCTTQGRVASEHRSFFAARKGRRFRQRPVAPTAVGKPPILVNKEKRDAPWRVRPARSACTGRPGHVSCGVHYGDPL